MNKNILKQFDEATDELAIMFVEKYFGKDFLFDDDFYWVGSQDEDREVLAVNDYYFTLDRIVESIRYKATKKQLFDFYDTELERLHKNIKGEINFRNYVKYGKFGKEKKHYA